MGREVRDVPVTVEERREFFVCDQCGFTVDLAPFRSGFYQDFCREQIPRGYWCQRFDAAPGLDTTKGFCSIECLSAWALEQVLGVARADERESA